MTLGWNVIIPFESRESAEGMKNLIMSEFSIPGVVIENDVLTDAKIEAAYEEGE